MRFGRKNRSPFKWRIVCWGLLINLFACKSNSSGRPFRPAAKDTVQLIQTMLNNQILKDSIFSKQVSQKLIIHKDQHIPLNAFFTYNSKPAAIQEVKFMPRDIDIDHPRFLIAIGKCEIKDSTAVLEFVMPDVGMGISTSWTRKKIAEPWVVSKWNDEYY